MKAGKLRHLLQIQERTELKNSYGEPVETWRPTSSTWGEIKPLSGDELFNANQIKPNVSHEIRIRYGSAVTPGDKMKFGARTFHIESVMNQDERNRELRILARELV